MFNNLQEYAVDLLRKLDKDGTGVIAFAHFFDVMKSQNTFFTREEQHELLRKFDHDDEHMLNLEEFYNALA